MSISFNGTSISNNYTINFNNNTIEKIICNGSIVWEKLTEQSGSKNISWSKSWGQGDQTFTETILDGSVTVKSVTITGKLISNSSSNEEEDYRCNSTLYINGTIIADLYSNQGQQTLSVNKTLTDLDGLIISLLVHPHSSDEAEGSFSGTVSYTYLG